MPVQVVSAEFAKTATRPEEWPRGPMPEIAFVGRSNVGQVVDAERARAAEGARARLPRRPGRTRALQFFDLAYRPDAGGAPAARSASATCPATATPRSRRTSATAGPR